MLLSHVSSSNLVCISHLLVVVGSCLLCIVLLDGQEILLALSSRIALLTVDGMWNGSLLLLSLLFLFDGSILTVVETVCAAICAHMHIGINWALFLGAKQAGVVLGEIFLLTLAHLAAHDETRAKLHGLWIDDLSAGIVILLAHTFQCVWRWLHALID